MTSLWSKESRQRSGIYTDLFDDVSERLKIEFVKWDQKLAIANWKHRFLYMINEPEKSDSTSLGFINKGNEYFEQQEWRKAMELYNQALCFVEVNSSQMSSLYSKRGFCFSNMKMYDEGLHDMELALSMKLPEEEIEMVEQIKANNVQLRVLYSPKPLNIPKLNFQPSQMFPCMANVLEIKHDDSTGNSFIIANDDIDAGQTILVEESFASIANGYDTAYCFRCLNVVKNFIPCSNCTDVMFCSSDCMNEDNVHRISCGEAYHRMPSNIKFIVQSILQAITLFPSVDDLKQFVETHVTLHPGQSSNSEDFGQLWNYGLFLMQSTKTDLPMLLVYQAFTTLLKMSSIKIEFDTRTKKQFLMHLVGHHTMVLMCNAFGGFETDQNQYISANMANVMSLFEHSCTPNLVHFSLGNREIAMTIRPVKAGEHLCYDFWPQDENNENRKEQLQRYYGIECECSKCNPEQERRSIGEKMAADPTFFFVMNYKKYFDNHSPTLLKQKCYNFLQKFKYEKWTKEVDVVTKAYIRCLIADIDHRKVQL